MNNQRTHLTRRARRIREFQLRVPLDIEPDDEALFASLDAVILPAGGPH